ncbi:MAG: helix-turn-helix domain-containing protein [Campylobacteraceae bacterium]
MSEKENIVKLTCKELGITQKELGEILDIPQPTIARWQSGDIPKMAQRALELLLETRELKTKLNEIRKIKDLILSI